MPEARSQKKRVEKVGKVEQDEDFANRKLLTLFPSDQTRPYQKRKEMQVKEERRRMNE